MIDEQSVSDHFHAVLDVEPPPGAFPVLAEKLRQAGRHGVAGRRRTATKLVQVAAIGMIVAVVTGAFVVLAPANPLRLGRTAAQPRSPGPPIAFVNGTDLRMVTPTTGWLVTVAGRVLRTTDGGAHWTDVTYRDATTTPSVVQPSAVDWYFPDATHAYIADTPGDGRMGVIIYGTSDGGQTWRHSTVLKGQTSGFPHPLLYFIDKARGWLLLGTSQRNPPSVKDLYGAQALYSTVDGGLHWKQLANSGSDHFGCAEERLVFVSATTGWMSACGASLRPLLVVTHDGGAKWQAQTLPLADLSPSCGSDCWLEAPIFSSELRGLVIAHYFDGSRVLSALFATSDGGRTWATRHLPGVQEELVLRWPEDMDPLSRFRDPDHGYAVAWSAVDLPNRTLPTVNVPLYLTTDGGLTWTRVATNLTLETLGGRVFDIRYIDELHGFALRGGNSAGELLSTADGGRTWNTVGAG